MQELIKVSYKDNSPTVSARELHEFLEVSTHFKDWFPRMCEYGFTESEDYNPLKNERVQLEGARMVNRAVDDAQLTTSMAKEICMIQRTEKGKQARLYFLSIEKAWNQPETVMARALQMAETKMQGLQITNNQLKLQAAADKPKVLFADSVAASSTAISISELAKILKQNGCNTGQNRLFALLRSDGYLIRRAGNDYNMPTQKSMELGLFEIKERTITNPSGSVFIIRTPKVTGKGQQYFLNRYVGARNAS